MTGYRIYLINVATRTVAWFNAECADDEAMRTFVNQLLDIPLATNGGSVAHASDSSLMNRAVYLDQRRN